MKSRFEAFNRANWDPERYADYLADNYGVRSDSSIVGDPAISHHLPTTLTQQYYEMTGKYDQFAWGWTDARLNGSDLDELHALDQLPVVISSDSSTLPYSANRVLYEQMRYDSNQKFKSARRVASLILVNHLIAGLEAFFSARSHNRTVGRSEGLAQWRVRAGLKSHYAAQDTPYLQVSYKF